MSPYRPLFVETDMNVKVTLDSKELREAILDYLAEKTEYEFEAPKVTFCLDKGASAITCEVVWSKDIL